MRYLVVGAIVLVLAVAATASHHGPPPRAYSPCTPAALAPLVDPNAFCVFHGETITVGEYQARTVPNGGGTP